MPRPGREPRCSRAAGVVTGDVATVDEDGFPTIVDRAKALTITGGCNPARLLGKILRKQVREQVLTTL
ncbi:hypothetical protein E3O21_10270 [Cryobacterium flavum]|uniref:Uncharacterized protein n=1 Tax=Cryobacterium flavum TaxID=1424659 RepID=A0ABY2I590_9MICO|nr:hypothetical protein E3O21_10270 [Cryobacterium flavum]